MEIVAEYLGFTPIHPPQNRRSKAIDFRAAFARQMKPTLVVTPRV